MPLRQAQREGAQRARYCAPDSARIGRGVQRIGSMPARWYNGPRRAGFVHARQRVLAVVVQQHDFIVVGAHGVCARLATTSSGTRLRSRLAWAMRQQIMAFGSKAHAERRAGQAATLARMSGFSVRSALAPGRGF